jgi:hypothetical protein
VLTYASLSGFQPMGIKINVLPFEAANFRAAKRGDTGDEDCHSDSWVGNFTHKCPDFIQCQHVRFLQPSRSLPNSVDRVQIA